MNALTPVCGSMCEAMRLLSCLSRLRHAAWSRILFGDERNGPPGRAMTFEPAVLFFVPGVAAVLLAIVLAGAVIPLLAFTVLQERPLGLNRSVAGSAILRCCGGGLGQRDGADDLGIAGPRAEVPEGLRSFGCVRH